MPVPLFFVHASSAIVVYFCNFLLCLIFHLAVDILYVTKPFLYLHLYVLSKRTTQLPADCQNLCKFYSATEGIHSLHISD